MPLPIIVAFRVELAGILANAAALQIRLREYYCDQETYQTLADYPIPEDLTLEFAEKRLHFEGELNSILDILATGKYHETRLSTLESFYFPGDAEDVENYGQALMDWTSDIRKHLIQLKAETAKMLRDKENESEIPKDWLLSEFLTYEQRLKNIYRSVVKLESWLRIKYKPPPVLPDTKRTSGTTPNDGVPLTERLDKIRNTITTFQVSHSEHETRLCEVQKKYQTELLRRSSFSSPYSNTIFQAVDSIISECSPHLVSTAKSEYQQVLTDNEQAFHDHLQQKLNPSLGLIQVVLGVTNAALMSEPEEGELIE